MRYLQVCRKVLTDVGASGTSILSAVGVPIRPVSNTFTTLTAALFATVTDLLMVRDLAVHLPFL